MRNGELAVVVGLALIVMGLLAYSYLTSLEMFVSVLAAATGLLAVVLYFRLMRSVAVDLRLQEEERLPTSSPRNCTTPN
jgi:Flp pilus assembly protein TadB